jgi:Holliday junction DNA helicase RuvB
MSGAYQKKITGPEAQAGEFYGVSRPRYLEDFFGQEELKQNLKVFISAAQQRKEPLDHILLAGPPGLGKTTLANIIARERGANLRTTSGPALQRQGDLAALLTGLEPFDVLFIDEIHRLNLQVEEILYPALEDYALDIIIGEGAGARSVRVQLNPFTLVGATTRSGLISGPLRDRFGITLRLDFYSQEVLAEIIAHSAAALELTLSPRSIQELAKRSRGTPRIAERLLRRVRDFLLNWQGDDYAGVLDGLKKLGIDEAGLDHLDYRYLRCLAETFSGRAVGVDSLAAALGETRDTIEDGLEPYLLRCGFIERTPRGRVATALAHKHLGLK